MPLTPDRFMKANEVKDQWGLNLLVYGEPGSGKTVFAASAQDHESGKDVLIVDVECGTRSLIDRPDVSVFPCKQFSDLKEIYDHLTTQKHSWRTIVIDSITDVQVMCLDEIIGPKVKAGQAPGIQDFGKAKLQMVSLIRAFKSLATSRGWNVIFTALCDTDKDETTGVHVRSPSLSPKTCQAICACVDGVGLLSIDAKGQRVLQLAQNHNTVAKIRQPASKPGLPGTIVNPTMPAILDYLAGKRKSL